MPIATGLTMPHEVAAPCASEQEGNVAHDIPEIGDIEVGSPVCEQEIFWPLGGPFRVWLFDGAGEIDTQHGHHSRYAKRPESPVVRYAIVC